MRTNTSLTVYNRVIMDRETRYQRTVIKKVFFQEKQASNRLVSGFQEADKVITLIPMKHQSTRKYKPFKEFNNLKDKENYFTLQNEDIIVKGDIDYEIKGDSLKEIEKLYPIFRITSVDTYDFGSRHMQHIKVGAK